MKKVIFFSLFLVSFKLIEGQVNLVPNSSFESYDTCAPYNISHIIPWVSPTSGHPDFFNTCLSSFGFGVPSNLLGYQNPRTGATYVGIDCYEIYLDPPNLVGSYREYLQVKLSDSLITNKNYHISFYTGFMDSIYTSTGKIAITEIGLYLSHNAVSLTNWSILPYPPQITSPIGIYLNDSANWVEVGGNYTALGGEKYITIGNFKDDTLTDKLIVKNSTNGTFLSYYFIDDVSVVCTNCEEGVEETKSESNFTILPNPNNGIMQIKNEKYAIKNIAITNVLGESVYTAITNQFQINLNLPNLPSGVYFVSCLINNRTVVKKFVKE